MQESELKAFEKPQRYDIKTQKQYVMPYVGKSKQGDYVKYSAYKKLLAYVREYETTLAEQAKETKRLNTIIEKVYDDMVNND